MPKRNFKKILIGFFLLVIAATSGLTAFYYLKVKPELASREEELSASVEKMKSTATMVKQTVSESKDKQKSGTAETTKASGMNLKSIVDRAKSTYSEAEQKRKEGYLWIDRANSKFIVTLGAVQGLLPGDYLTVYDGDKKIGQVTIETPFDVTAYVRPLGESADLFKKNYYHVVKE